ncbi:hypothetical protein BK669_15310 [Pseudomonas fluorescens]|uniref:hypothetical protein n=1 Tax=Pseudomonas protegens TaxID=380021 RepID=UPI000F4617DF|nr:hypothetical protein BK669_15310 [Pseudomonas fluorescens]
MGMREEHPVWDVYDLLRTARLNEKYYGCRLERFELINTSCEIIIAVTATSSAVASLPLWGDGVGAQLWKYLIFLSAVISVIKPFLQLTKKIRAYEELYSGYRMLFFDLKTLRVDINQAQQFSKVHQARFNRIKERQRQLVGNSPERTENEKLKKACISSVLLEMPTESFYVPRTL